MHTEPRSEQTIAVNRLASCAEASPLPQRLSTRSTSWLEIAQHGQPSVICASSWRTVPRMCAALKSSVSNSKL